MTTITKWQCPKCKSEDLNTGIKTFTDTRGTNGVYAVSVSRADAIEARRLAALEIF